MIRKHKKYVRPRQIFKSERIKKENDLADSYGLKNKTEIWKTQAKVDYFRGRAKELAKKSREEQEVLFNKLRSLGLKVEGTADVLDLKVEDILKRRLTTVLVKKKLANTPKHARQLVTHKKVLINGKTLSSPSYLVPVAYEDKITIKKKEKKKIPSLKEKEENTESLAEEKQEVQSNNVEETRKILEWQSKKQKR